MQAGAARRSWDDRQVSKEKATVKGNPPWLAHDDVGFSVRTDGREWKYSA